MWYNRHKNWRRRAVVIGIMKKKQLRAFFCCVGVWFTTLAILWLILIGTALIPNERIRANMEKSALSYAQKEAFAFTDGRRWNGIADHYADSILLGVAWHMGSDDPLRSSLDTKYYDGEDFGENYGLYLSVTEDAEPNTDYTRYWHGTASVVRVFHLFTDVNGIKAIGFAALLLLIAGTLGWLIYHKHIDLAIILLISLAAVQVWNVRLSVEYQPSFLIAFALSLVYLLTEKKSDLFMIVLGVVGGACVCFFDFLTTETLTILLPLSLVTAIRAKEKRLGDLRKNCILYLKCCGAWAASYVSAFFAKWTITSLVTGENAFADAFASVAERIGGDVQTMDAAVPKSIFSSITANFSAMLGMQTRAEYAKTWIIISAVILILFSVWYLFRDHGENKTAAVLLMIPASGVLIRFLILNNHSFMHNFFTYRALLSAVLAILSAGYLSIRLPRKRRGRG